jgi:nitrilase
MKAGLAQISPVWLDKSATLSKIEATITRAGEAGCDLVVFGEALLPGYPFWIGLTDGAAFDSKIQKELFAHYLKNSVQPEKGDLNGICELLKSYNMACYLGLIERAEDRGGHSLYCSLAYIDCEGKIASMHRKLQPTYEERLAWAPGDGNGLRVHQYRSFVLGGLNCWENWMPLVRSALYGQGENLHVAVWPGSDYNTKEITRFIARESRSFVISVSGLMQANDFPIDTPHLKKILSAAPEVLANGGSCVAGPDGEWILEPVIGEEGLFEVELDVNRVYEERQNFDPSGHYSRPDVTKLLVNRSRQTVLGDSTDSGFEDQA